ncbi:hypothetical protein [Butyrivibrio sp. M55]|uniref:hypothetical protein n=1 Tax=Butyrivibrio sp. M55 TaxID=1855323 RepID=UPI0008E9AE95|nr:hypothetical protein [Butyrivibrio sp. M55]SFU91662.1 hypothetical protein SAMN05216540_1214 [Butyrivibrio sp. M55]
MVESDYLDQGKLKQQCHTAISVFAANNEKLSGLRRTYNSSRDVTFTGKGAESFVGHCDNYVVLIDAIMTANDCDIADNKTLWAMLGTEILDGSVILPRKSEAKQKEQDERQKADDAKSNRDSAPEDEKGYWDSKYQDHLGMADIYEEEYNYWKGLEEKFDQIDTDSKGLFKDSKPIRAQATQGLKELSRDFSQKTFEFFYNPLWKDGIEKLCNQVSVVDKCKEKWKDENGVYNLAVLNDIYKNKVNNLSAPEVKAFTEVLKELHPKAQKQVIGHAVKDADIQGLIKGIIKSVGTGGKVGVDAYNIAASDNDKGSRRVAGFKLVQDVESAFATWSGTLVYSGDIKKANGMLYSSVKKGSFLELISEKGANLKNVSRVEIAERSLKYDAESYLFKNVKEAGAEAVKNADDLTGEALRKVGTEAERAAKLKNFKAGVKWAGAIADFAFNVVDNFEEQEQARISGVEMTNGRVVAESVIETGVDVVLSIGGTALAGFILGSGAPVLAVGAVSVGVVWTANFLMEIAIGKDIAELASDAVCDASKAVASFTSKVFGG